MHRDERLVIKLHKAERYAIERYAQAAKLPVSTLARAILLGEAEQWSLGSIEKNSIPTNSKSASVKVCETTTGAFAENHQ